MTQPGRAPVGRGGGRDLPRPRPLGPRLLRARDQPRQRGVRRADGRALAEQGEDVAWDLAGLVRRARTSPDAAGKTTGWTATAFLPWSGFRRCPRRGRSRCRRSRATAGASTSSASSGPGGKAAPEKDAVERRLVAVQGAELPRAARVPRPRVRRGAVAAGERLDRRTQRGGSGPTRLPRHDGGRRGRRPAAVRGQRMEPDGGRTGGCCSPSATAASGWPRTAGTSWERAGRSPTARRLGWICMILVDPARRGRGIGTRVFEERSARPPRPACGRRPGRHPRRPRPSTSGPASRRRTPWRAWSGSRADAAPQPDGPVRPLGAGRPRGRARIDHEASGADRGPVLTGPSRRPRRTRGARSHGRARGVRARPPRPPVRAPGPGRRPRRETAEALVAACLAHLRPPGRSVSMSGRAGRWLAALHRQGFREGGPSHGCTETGARRRSRAGRAGAVFARALAGPDVLG